jgi:hypothetical protein
VDFDTSGLPVLPPSSITASSTHRSSIPSFFYFPPPCCFLLVRGLRQIAVLHFYVIRVGLCALSASLRLSACPTFLPQSNPNHFKLAGLSLALMPPFRLCPIRASSCLPMVGPPGLPLLLIAAYESRPTSACLLPHCQELSPSPIPPSPSLCLPSKRAPYPRPVPENIVTLPEQTLDYGAARSNGGAHLRTLALCGKHVCV